MFNPKGFIDKFIRKGVEDVGLDAFRLTTMVDRPWGFNDMDFSYIEPRITADPVWDRPLVEGARDIHGNVFPAMLTRGSLTDYRGFPIGSQLGPWVLGRPREEEVNLSLTNELIQQMVDSWILSKFFLGIREEKLTPGQAKAWEDLLLE